MNEPLPRLPWKRVGALDDYEVARADLRTALAAALHVWGHSIGWPGRQAEMYRAFYLDCPVGQPELTLLRHRPTREVVGTLGVGPRNVAWNGRSLRAGVLSHFCVRAPHRRIRPPTLLLEAVIAACAGRYDVLYAMPGTPEAVALSRRLCATPACFVSRNVRVLRHGGYLRRLLPGGLAAVAGAAVDAVQAARDAWRGRGDTPRVEWTETVDPRMAALWADSPPPAGWHAARDDALLRWRFDRLPSHRRRYLLVGGSGGLRAWFACDTSHFDPGILVVQDFWFGHGTAGEERPAVRALCRAARAAGFAALEMRLAAPERHFAAWRAEGFAERNRFPVFVSWLAPELADGPPGPFHVTELDNDG